MRRKRRKIRQIYGNIADFSYDGNDPGNLYGKNSPVYRLWEENGQGFLQRIQQLAKGSWICRNKVRYIVNKNGSGHAVAAVAGGNNGMGRRAGESGFYRDRLDLPENELQEINTGTGGCL